MNFAVEVFSAAGFAEEAARRISSALPQSGAVVVTGGTTAQSVYPALARGRDWSGIDVFFSDERCVPPHDDASNFKMATTSLLDHVGARRVHRMRGEEPPVEAAARYHAEVAPAVERGLALVLLGMGADAHVAAMFPGSDALEERSRYCIAVERPDGLSGLTLTPPALSSANEILLVVAGEEKADAVARAVASDEPPQRCPARIFAHHENATFLLDEGAASRL